MPTRLYLPSAGSPPITPAYSADWADTSVADRHLMVQAPSGTPMTTVVFDQTPDLLGKILLRQYVSPLLAPQVISGEAVAFQIRTQAGPAGTSSFLTWGLRAFSEAGALLATLVPVTATGPKLQNVLTNEGSSAPITITLVAPAYLVLELGVNSTALMGSTHTEQRIGDAAASDLPYSIPVTTDLNPWFEFQDPFFTPLFVYEGAAVLEGDGSLVASAEVIHYVNASANLTGTGTLSSKAGKVKQWKPGMGENWRSICWSPWDVWPSEDYLYLP